MALKSVVLHFGAHKTGTSLIQKYMRDRKSLCDAQKVLAVPRGDADLMIAWGRARDLAAGGPELLQRVTDSNQQGVEHFVISHENSLGRPFHENADCIYPEAFKRARNIRNSLGDQPYRVVFYIRSQASFIESYYLQTVHEGSSADFQTFMTGLGEHGFSWVPVYENLTKLFGAENVILRSFEAEIARGQEAFLQRFFETFSKFSPSSYKKFQYGPVRNPSIGDRGLELALNINRYFKPGPEHKLLRKFLQDNFSNRTYPRPKLLSSEQKGELAARYDDENASLVSASEAAYRHG